MASKGFWWGSGIGQAGRGGKGLEREPWGHGTKDAVGGQGSLPSVWPQASFNLSGLQFPHL